MVGRNLIKYQEKDFQKCITYYKTLKINKRVFDDENMGLLRCAHKIAFTMGLWVNKLSNAPKWALPYLHQLMSDTIQLTPSIVLGNRRSLHLYERACIEDFLRYIYFFDHKIEHILLQDNPTKFKSFDFLVNWVKTYPTMSSHENLVLENCNILSSSHSELSRTIHGTIVSHLELSDSLKSLHAPIKNAQKELNSMKSIFKSIFFLLCLFHLHEFNEFLLDERKILCQFFGKKEKQALSGISKK